MSAASFRAMREFLGLPGSWVGARLGVTERAVRKWESGETPVPDDVADWIEALAVRTGDFVADTAERLRADPAGRWPFEIPRRSQDASQMAPFNDLPVDWWRNVGARLMGEVSGLWLDWIDGDPS